MLDDGKGPVEVPSCLVLPALAAGQEAEVVHHPRRVELIFALHIFEDPQGAFEKGPRLLWERLWWPPEVAR